MDIGIIGSGNIGSTLARHLTALGHQVSIANSRGPASLAALAAETGATAATVEQAARAQDVVIIAVPEKAVPQLPRDILAATSAVVVDTGNYYPARDGRIAEIEGGLTDSEWVARVLGVPWSKRSTTSSPPAWPRAASRPAPRGASASPSPGTIRAAKELVLGLIDALGFDGIDAGTLADSWRQHPGAQHGEPLRRRVLDQRRGEESEPGPGARRRADEQERQLAMALVPRGNRGVGDQRGGVGGHGGPEQPGAGAGRPPSRRDPGQLARRAGDVQRRVGEEDPHADAHRRRRLEHPQHVEKARRAAQVVDERGQRGADRRRRAQLGAARQPRPAGEVGAGGEQRRAPARPPANR